MDIKTLYDANINNITIAKNAFDKLYSAFGQHIESWQHDVVDRLTNSHWTGTASDHAHARIQFLGTELQSAHSELDFVSKALAKAAEQFALAQAHLVYALDDAKNAKLNVAPDGRITWDKEPTSANYAGAGAETAAIAISNRIAAALNEADHADQEISARLNHFASNASNGLGLDAAMVAKDQAAETAREQIPAKGTDPANVKKWWDGLTETEQQKFIHDAPDQVGNLDGVPAATRDQANRLNLTRSQADLQKQLSDLDKSEPLSVTGTPYGATESPDHIVWKAEREALQGKLKGLQAIQDRLDQPVTEQNPQPFLLGLDAYAPGGRAILALNNPDTADHVATFVPGTESKLAGVGGTMDKAKEMYRSAIDASPGSKVSTIAYVNYTAPQSAKPSFTQPVPDAAYEGYAKDAEQNLYDFQSGLRATHQGSPSHNTIIGHSYGSTVVGYAMRDKGLPVDSVVFAGSPGVGVDKAGDLNVDLANGTKMDPSKVYAVKSSGDSIDTWTTDPLDPDNYNPASDDDHLRFGRNPMNPAFGAQHLPSQDTDHDHYWNKGTPSWKAFGRVIVGGPGA
ncbi:alpha/beta hydrolase [Kitasatospora sp. NPDC048296]|uniref:alpha/beta hydrolase n=1 Tax=Kitasatospora sp. NPDC048296 TaxID=3364048 RepID=UPI00371FF2FF